MSSRRKENYTLGGFGVSVPHNPSHFYILPTDATTFEAFILFSFVSFFHHILKSAVDLWTKQPLHQSYVCLIFKEKGSLHQWAHSTISKSCLAVIEWNDQIDIKFAHVLRSSEDIVKSFGKILFHCSFYSNDKVS